MHTIATPPSAAQAAQRTETAQPTEAGQQVAAAPSIGAATPAVPLDDPGSVDTLRTQIDALDAAIGQLITERARLSRRIQLARLNAGGPRVELGRERAIHQRYRAALGGAGGMVAEAVLRVCRGDR